MPRLKLFDPGKNYSFPLKTRDKYLCFFPCEMGEELRRLKEAWRGATASPLCQRESAEVARASD